MEDPGFLTVAEIAVMLRVSKMTVYRLARSGELPATRVGRSYRVREADFLAYTSAGRARPVTATVHVGSSAVMGDAEIERLTQAISRNLRRRRGPGGGPSAPVPA